MNLMMDLIDFMSNNPVLITFLFLMIEANGLFIYLYLTQSSIKYNLPKAITIPKSTKVISVTINIEHPTEHSFNSIATESLNLGYYPSSDKVNLDGNWHQSMTISI